MREYTIERYYNDLDKKGLKKTWFYILNKIYNNQLISNFFCLENFGELYEMGLAHINKTDKKEAGKYYTPKDVAILMASWLYDLKCENVCDVGCGTGNLILAYLELIGKNEAFRLIDEGHLYLYDMDEVALKICKYTIALKYGKELLSKINAKHCDFLSKKVKLPKNSKVISNPPYYKITNIGEDWKITETLNDSHELYSCFMEKIMEQSDKSVIITPYSFIGGGKFYSLRQKMNKYNGFVVSFDNVPGNIFNGRKYGVFNSNKGNSVRAAITVVENKPNENGFKISPLIRFKSEEREKVLNKNLLENLVNKKQQMVSSNKKSYYKCHKELIDVFEKWKLSSDQKMENLISKNNGYEIYVPTTCRYFTVGSKKNLKRNGKRIVYVIDKAKYNYVYCLLNSSFAYWFWRLYDGGINCPLAIINNIPVFYNKLKETDKNEIDMIAKEMQQNETKYLTYKMNAGKKQENIKFPKKYRDRINNVFLRALNINEDSNIFNRVHSSSLFEESEDDNNE